MQPDDDKWISKSQRKRECHDLQELGNQLVKLADAELEKIPLPDDLYQAIVEARHIRQHGALKRQLQFIGKLMRNADAEAIRAAYDQTTNHYRQDIRQLHQLEQWRDRLLEQGDQALEELLADYPQANRQQIRQWIRSAHSEKLHNRPAKSARELFQYLKSLLFGD